VSVPAFECPSALSATKRVMDILGDGLDGDAGGTNKNERPRRLRWMW
jgi:hypothetical protein